MPIRCGECGKREMVYKSVKGRSDFPYKTYKNVKIEVDLELLTCANCGNVGLKAGECEKLDKAIEESIKIQTQYLVEIIVKNNGCEQKELASHVGVTSEHLSQIKNGKMIPSFTTFNFLKTLAMTENTFKISSPEVNVKIDNKVAMSRSF